MGWTSSSDSLAGQTPGNMNFESKDAAIAFAEKNGEFNAFHVTTHHSSNILLSHYFLGWKIVLEEPNDSKVRSLVFYRCSSSPPFVFHHAHFRNLQIHKVRVKSYGENYQWEGESDMEGTVKLRTTHK
jgi:hypothetical protein